MTKPGLSWDLARSSRRESTQSTASTGSDNAAPHSSTSQTTATHILQQLHRPEYGAVGCRCLKERSKSQWGSTPGSFLTVRPSGQRTTASPLLSDSAVLAGRLFSVANVLDRERLKGKRRKSLFEFNTHCTLRVHFWFLLFHQFLTYPAKGVCEFLSFLWPFVLKGWLY